MSKHLILTGLVTVLVAGAALAAIPAEKVTRPADSKPYEGDRKALVARGEALWNDKSLSGNGKRACATCHKGNTKSFKASFADDYPHKVKMPEKKAGMAQVDAEEMVQFCFLAAMGTDDVLPWDSEELAALTAYTVDVVQKDYRESIAGKE